MTSRHPSGIVAGFDDLELATLRRRSGVKWARAEGVNALPAWVADMDYPMAAPIRQALIDTIESGDIGYPNWLNGTPLRSAFADRMENRYGWRLDPTAVREHTDLIQALQLVLRLSTRPGDAVAIQTPNYPPFLATLHRMGLTEVDVPFTDTESGWTIDFGEMERTFARRRPKVLVLVNPHNPTGRVLTRYELERCAELAEQFEMLVISDEIHAELTYAPHRHIPFASVSQAAACRTVTLTSAGKAFNLAGLRCAVAHYGSPSLLASRDAEPPDIYGAVSIPGVVATLAAWRHGDEWQDTLTKVLDRNRTRLHDALRAVLPAARHHLPEATYLSWVDVSAMGIDNPVEWVLHKGAVMLDGGIPFGEASGQRIRINFATSESILERIIVGITDALNQGASLSQGQSL
ncbi:aminotransferase class I/II-fold pyridoxal phosphate-dependent enzyme [Mycolicibacterium sp. CH28]|uniref:MalY/PatB family protein n=1 Tax=Mycolicibacterium sp. CH28 TaxID=2512237 RepID=UPI001081FA58|nr:aminotransferase class I/II-fold pyridoxal phosphate-dependent enzyme [Mycolicibacterium sp. CH28]TGD84526.1 aminotransferase class I/II-fold pyridoxal phosphate-dependent enzyme [Mycolicibacterium sp. CH28]